MAERGYGWKTQKQSSAQRGYGAQHIRLRRKWAAVVALGRTPCARCAQLIKPNDKWHLGHDDNDRTKYTGPEHAVCNLKGASKKAHEIRHKRNPEPQPQTDW